MKANEICIGDWIAFNDTYRMIAGIHEYPEVVMLNTYLPQLGYRKSTSSFRIEYAKPIPLTAEILKKNGFEYGYTTSEEDFCASVGCNYPEDKGWCYDEGAGEIKIIFPNDTDGGLIRLDDQCGDRHLEIVFVKPIMLHELQNAFRLCGIEKTIEL